MRHFFVFFISVLLINGLLFATSTSNTERTQKERLLKKYSTQKAKSLARHNLRPISYMSDMSKEKQVKFKRFARGTDRLIIKYKDRTADAAVREAIVQKHRLQIKTYLPMSRLHIYKSPAGTDKRGLERLLKELRQNDQVEYVEPDYIVSMAVVPNDPYYSESYGLKNTGQNDGTAGADIDAEEAWGITTGSSNVIVAVIDSGVDYTHDDLVANLWTNPGETPGDSTDNDGNGYIDDVYGIDAIANNGDPWDDNSHGTHCAGIVGAVGNNGIGVAGVCWDVKIMSLKFLDSAGNGYTSDAITCIEYAVANGAQIISSSWVSHDYSQALSDAIIAARDAGVLFIAAAGNFNTNIDVSAKYPASYTAENIIGVAASDVYDYIAYFSCIGPTSVDVAAPGKDIFSTIPGNGYASLSGTSMAAAHVAGVAALIKADDPTATWSQIKNRILDTVELQSDMDGRIATGGRVNAYDALNNSPRPAVTITFPTANSFVYGTMPVQVSVTLEETVTKMDFYVDDQLKSTITSAPWQYDWDTTGNTDDMHTVKVVVTDNISRTSQGLVLVRVHNAATPGVFVSSPGYGTTATLQTEIQAETFYAAGISKVEFYIDEVKIGEDTTAPYQLTWNSRDVANGSHTLKAKAIGTDLQEGESSTTIITDNIFLPAAERNALIALYNSTSGDLWDWNYGWKKEDGSFNDEGTEGDWVCIEIENNHVVSIDLSDNNLAGTLPPEIGDFSQLKHLQLYKNSIGGSIPVEIGNLTVLETLDLGDNHFNGTLPAELFNLVNLKELWLYENAFSGSIPAAIDNLTNLETLVVHGTQLSGAIPAEMGNLTALIYCGLEENQLSGSIPPELGNLPNLITLDLEDNLLTGSIPLELGNLAALTYLDLRNNSLTGAVPSELGNLSNLTGLHLSGNRISGAVPTNITNLSSLQYMNLDFNALYTANDTVRAFVTSFDSDWETNQTVAPEDLSAVTLSEASAQLTWTPIAFNDGHTGGYRVYYSTALGGPYTLSHTTADKQMSTTTVSGLIPGTTHYFKLQSVSDPHSGNKNTVESEYTDAVSSLTLPMSITVQSPNGGESFDAGTTQTITWISDGAVGTVKIEYSTAGMGGTFITIGDSLPDTGSANWTIPNVDSNQCFVRITSASGSVSDTSDAVFTIVPFPVLTVTSPNGGESMAVDSGQTITWDEDFYAGNIRLQLYKNSGYVRDISPGLLPVTDGSYNWTVPNDLTGGLDYQVRIVSESGAVEDYSDSTFAIRHPYSLGLNQPDFNGDDKPDILMRHYGSGSNLVWFMNGAVKIDKAWLEVVTDPNWRFDAVTDFNGDAKPDIILRNYSSGANLVWYMDGAVKTDKDWLETVADTNWHIEGSADFNGDGQPDILLRNYSTGSNLVWFMKGIVKVDKVWLEEVSDTDWRFDGLADFNGDGKVDILMRNYRTGLNLVWYMDGTTKIGKDWLPSITDTNWTFEGVSDFNGDGKPDILMRNYSTGLNLVWYMDGVTKIGKDWLTAISDTNWRFEN